MGKSLTFESKQQCPAFIFTAIVFLLLFVRLGASAQDRALDRHMIDHWQMPKDFPSKTIISINQTPDGCLWVGTSRGLLRFDGLEFIPVPFAQKKEIYSQDIRDIFVDKEQNIWIGSTSGLTRYNHKSGQGKTFTSSDGITIDGVRRITGDNKGNLWISFTSSFVNRFADGKFTVFDTSHGLEGKKINAIVQHSRDTLLFGTSEKGVFAYKGGSFSRYLIKGLRNVRINAMQTDRQGNLWIGTNHGLFYVKGKKAVRYTTSNGLSDNYVSAILEDSKGNLWIGTLNAGLNRIIKEDGKILFERLLKTKKILFLFEDREKSLWVGTYSSGIKRIRDRKIFSYEPLDAYPGEILFSLHRDRNSDNWIGTVSGKLFCCQKSHLMEVPVTPEISGSGIAAIAEDKEGNLWLGTIGKGVFQKKNGSFARYTAADGLADNQVTSIFKDSRGDLWFSTYDGVSVRHHDGVFVSFKTPDGLSGKRVHNVYEDRAGNIWIAADKGITILKKGSWSPKADNIKYYLEGVSVTCIYEDPVVSKDEEPVYWIATVGAGMIRIRSGGENIISYTEADGMTTDFIYRFFEDRFGYFWLMSKKGILCVNKNELHQFDPGSTDKINCISFGTEDGMESPEFNNEFSRNSALRTRDGKFWFITRKGVSIVDPAKIRFNTILPPVVIEKVFFDGRSIPLDRETGTYTFTGKKNFRICFSSITFLSPGKLKFKYRLEGPGGKGGDWVFLPPSGERSVSFSELSFGSYTFKVTACNADGVWQSKGASFAFTLQPFFYQTPFFIIGVLLLVFLLAGVVFYIYRKRAVEKRRKYKSSNLNPHFAGECAEKLTHLMEVDRVYRIADLSLRSLAKKIKVKQHILSQVLNERMNSNFYAFINDHRIKEAKEILKNPRRANLKMDFLAGEVGFNTKAAFYNSFKKSTGMTPSQYKKKFHLKITKLITS
ncbi:MAG: helix-turn-helix domain-containing protein [Candidatus Aminicenantes bacterium]|nr:helix-turn-helix domain-containing protein [Candidatus Aminicenantes bacterium]